MRSYYIMVTPIVKKLFIWAPSFVTSSAGVSSNLRSFIRISNMALMFLPDPEAVGSPPLDSLELFLKNKDYIYLPHVMVPDAPGNSNTRSYYSDLFIAAIGPT